MAGDWIKVEHVLPDKPEVDQLATLLNLDYDAVVGKLVRFWIWADSHSVDGNALIVTSALIDRLTYCPGFSDGLLKVGWLVRRSGHFSLPNFDRHNGQTAKSRALTKSRVKRSRNAASVTAPLPEIEKRRVDIHTPRAREKIEPKGELDTPEFRVKWEGWCEHMWSTNHKTSAAVLESQLMDLDRRGHDKAIRDIEFTLRCGNNNRILDSDVDFEKRRNGKQQEERADNFR